MTSVTTFGALSEAVRTWSELTNTGLLLCGLEHDDELDAGGFEPSPDLHHFAEARMEPVADAGFGRLFVGTM
jgi:hypothetical protein